MADQTVGATTPEEERNRFEAIVLALLGEFARPVAAEVDESGRLTALEVRHRAGVRVFSSGVRCYIERTIEATHADPWRAQWDLTHDRVRFERRASSALPITARSKEAT